MKFLWPDFPLIFVTPSSFSTTTNVVTIAGLGYGFLLTPKKFTSDLAPLLSVNRKLVSGLKSRLATMITILSLAALPLHSQDMVFKNSGSKATLVELYSSEGCSSCPPAEAWLTNLKDSPDLWTKIFPVAFHVDYWDGLGWPDRFAKPAYTQRQRNYAAALGQDSVYTPEFVTSGREWRGWFHGDRKPPNDNTTSGEPDPSG